MTTKNTTGKVITFYSYKGGTGRSMALANVACLLAKNPDVKKGVLIIDWDLEAPGLHRFFKPTLSFSESSSHLGLIDLFLNFEDIVSKKALHSTLDETDAQEVIEKSEIHKFIQDTQVPGLHLMSAGKFDTDYPKRINTFQWDKFFERSPYFFRVFAEYLTELYDYILIDSRTGITDTSGICTMILPEKLVVVFIPNQQSLTGVSELINRAITYRKSSDDLRPVTVYPLPSRIEANQPKLHDQWRHGDSEENIDGYQVTFERLMSEAYDLPFCDLTEYFDDVQIQYIPFYAYGEKIAVLLERSEDRLSIARSYEHFTERLIGRSSPWDINIKPKPLDDILQDKSDSETEMHMNEAEVFFYSGQYGKAIKSYERVLSLDPTWERAKDHLSQAQKFLQEGHIPTTALPAEAAILFGKAQSAFRVENYLLAKELFQDAKSVLQKVGINKWAEGADFEIRLDEFSTAQRLAEEADLMFSEGKIDSAIQNISIAESVTGLPKYKILESSYKEFSDQIRHLYSMLAGRPTPDLIYSSSQMLSELKSKYGDNVSLRSIERKIDIIKPLAASLVVEEVRSLQRSSERTNNLSDAIEFSEKAKYLLNIAGEYNLDGGSTLRLRQEIISRIDKLHEFTDRLEDAEVLFNKNRIWPSESLKISAEVRENYPNDPRVISLEKKLSNFRSAIALLRIVVFTIFTIVIYWLYTLLMGG